MSEERLNPVPPEGGKEGPEGTADLDAGAAFVTERGRSPSGVTNAAPAAANPPPAPAEPPLGQEEQAQEDAPDGSQAGPSDEAIVEPADNPLTSGPLPLPRLCGGGRARGRRLVKK